MQHVSTCSLIGESHNGNSCEFTHLVSQMRAVACSTAEKICSDAKATAHNRGPFMSDAVTNQHQKSTHQLPIDAGVMLASEANADASRSQELEHMARRRYQHPKPFKRGQSWYIRPLLDVFTDGQRERKQKRIRLAPATLPLREVQKIADEKLRPLNQGLESIGSAMNFGEYIRTEYRSLEMPLMAKSSRDRTDGVIRNYIEPAFGNLALREITPATVQRFFSGMANSKLSHESIDKIRDVMSAILQSAVKYSVLVKNPMEQVTLPRRKQGKRTKPYITPEQFGSFLASIPEPYASMVYVAIYTGLRASELIGLRWRNVHTDSISVEERCCRGDWGVPKSEASAATIAVNRCVIERIHRMKLLTVKVKAGRATREYKVVKSDGPDDLVFQSVKDGRPMRDNNILTRFIKPGGRKCGLPFVNWRCLRTSHATWLKMAGADVKDAQAQMRHSRASTTLDIYQQFVPERQIQVVEKLSALTTVIQ